MLVNKAYKYRLEPTAEQEIMLNKTAGCYSGLYTITF
jgi:hypothetical protein